jgi:hypothetical protein
MMPQSTGGAKKMNQAEVANEQAVDLLTTADSVTVVEQQVMTPMIQWFADLDHQFRDEAVTIRVYGDLGVRAKMEDVEPLQMDNRWEYRWYGVEAAQGAAAMQQKIAWTNVIKGIPPQLYADYELDLSPMLVQGTEDVFGPELAPLILKRKQVISMDPLIENDMMQHGFRVVVNPADNDQDRTWRRTWAPLRPTTAASIRTAPSASISPQRLAEMTPEERIEHRVNQRLAQVEFNGWNTNDQVAFQRAADRNPAVAALTEEVEAAFQAQLKAGKPTDRITIAKFLIGDKALSRAPRAKAAGKRATEAGRERQTAKPTSSRGDVAATGRRAASEAEARRKRLEDTLI